MRAFFAILGRLGHALSRLTMLLLALLVIVVVADVVVRTLGLRPLAWASSTAEYILLYAAFLPMPALVRNKGHVFVEFLRAPMTAPLRRVCAVLVYAVCVAICAYLGWVAATSGIAAWREGSYETRTFDMPKWLVYLPIATGFLLSAFEWLRFLLGSDSLYDVDPLTREGY